MDKRTRTITLVILLVMVGAVIYLLATPKAAMNPTPPEPTPGRADVPASSPAGAGAGAYVDYREGVIAATKDRKVLFFHAPWCPQCRKLEQSIKTGQIPSGVTIIKVDYDSQQALRQQYGVTIQTTLVRVNDQGGLVKKYVAYDTPTLEAVVNHVLD